MNSQKDRASARSIEMQTISPSSEPHSLPMAKAGATSPSHTIAGSGTLAAFGVSASASDGSTPRAANEPQTAAASRRPSSHEKDAGDSSSGPTLVTPSCSSQALRVVPPPDEEARALRAQREHAAGASADFHTTIVCTLTNLGNTCYFNSGVQLLCNCPALVFSLRDSAFRPPYMEAALLLSRASSMRTHALYRAFAQLLESMENHTDSLDSALSPGAALDLLGSVFPAFAGRSQQDCPEMVAAIVSNTEDEDRQDVEVDVLLRGFEATVPVAEAARAAFLPALSPAVQALGREEMLVTVTGPMSASVERTPTTEPYTPPHSVQTSRRTKKSRAVDPVGRCAETARLVDEELTPPLPGPWSAHTFAALRLMQAVNSSNAAVERRACERKGKLFDPVNSFRPPRLLRNSATDGFKGYSLSEITCKSCGAVSRIVEPFSTLILDIPTARQRVQFAKAHPEVERRTETGECVRRKKNSKGLCWYNPLTYVTCLVRALQSLFAPRVEYNLTLQECLDIHFEAAQLKDSNKYQCESCGRASEATKRESLVELPEYLLIQMKRFEVGQLLKIKKDDPVIFPTSWRPLTKEQAASGGPLGDASGATARLEVLDLGSYVHPDLAKCLAEAPPCLWQDGESESTEGTEQPPGCSATVRSFQQGQQRPCPVSPLSASAIAQKGRVTSTYTLDGVVNHHGSLGGGHYTVYVRKVDQRTGEETWVYMSDETAYAASVDEVANSQEYLLLYRKQAYVEPHGAALELRDKARFYLKRARDAGAGLPMERLDDEGSIVYLSRAWLHRAAFFTDPGPILNRTCYCAKADLRRVVSGVGTFPEASTRVPQDVPHVHGPPAEWFYVPVEEVDYWAFYTAYGGDAPVTAKEYAALQADQQRFLQELRRRSQRASARSV